MFCAMLRASLINDSRAKEVTQLRMLPSSYVCWLPSATHGFYQPSAHGFYRTHGKIHEKSLKGLVKMPRENMEEMIHPGAGLSLFRKSKNCGSTDVH